MREIILALSFDAEFLALSVYLDRQFGSAVADRFDERFRNFATTLAHSPRIGTTSHGYPTGLYAFVLAPCWVFYRFTDTELIFLHIRDGRMSKDTQVF